MTYFPASLRMKPGCGSPYSLLITEPLPPQIRTAETEIWLTSEHNPFRRRCWIQIWELLMRKSGQADAHVDTGRFGDQEPFREDAAHTKGNNNPSRSSRRSRRHSGRLSDTAIRAPSKSATTVTTTIGITLLLAASVTASSTPSISTNENALIADENQQHHQEAAIRAAAYAGLLDNHRGNDSSSDGGGGGGGGSRRELLGVGAAINWGGCTSDELWERVVDPTTYMYGCKEIKRMLKGDKTLVGNGYVRDVYLVDYGGDSVVVKTLRPVEGRSRQELHHNMHRREVLTLDALRGHPNIVGMLGMCETTVVTEYYPNNIGKIAFRHGAALPMRDVISAALDAARGLQALHEIVGGIHFDLKPQQLLVGDTGRVKMNDFNTVHLTRPDETGSACVAHGGCPPELIVWRPPENYAGKLLTRKMDIYSLGMIFYSLISGDRPYGSFEALEKAVSRQKRPHVDPSWHSGFVQLFRDMWRENPKKRPSAKQVVTRLMALQDDLAALDDELDTHTS